MSDRYPGGMITKTPVVPAGPYEDGAAPGIWTLEQQAYYKAQGLWPLAGNANPGDPYFNYVTMLLTGDGTNGAQNNTFLDSSSNAFSITRNGNTTQGSFSPYGSLWSNYFGGDNSKLNIGTTSSFNFLHNSSALFTIECWVNVKSTGTDQMIIATNDGGSANVGLNIQIQADGTLYFYMTRGVSGAANTVCYGASTGTITYNQWTHIAVTYDQSLSSANAKFYFNGVAGGTLTKTGNTPSSSNASYAMVVGADNVYTLQPLFGYISNFRVSNSIVYSSAFTPSTTPLTTSSQGATSVAVLTCQSNRFIDNSSNAYAITLSATPSVQRFSPFNPTESYSTATIGGSGYFDGTGDYLVVAGGSSNAYNFGTGNATVEAWVKTTQTSTGVIASNYSSGVPGVTDQWRVTMGQDVAGRVEWSQGSTVVAYNSKLVNDGAWHHVAAVINGGSVIIYVDGVAGSSASLSGYNYTATTDMYVGVYYYGSGVASPFNGYITNLRINKGTAVYTTNFTPPTSPLTAISGTTALLNFINAGIPDSAMMNDLETVGNAQVSTSVSKFGTGSLAFDGSGDQLNISPSNLYAFGTGDFTVEGWIYLNVNNIYQGVFSTGQYSTGQQATLRVTDTGKLNWFWGDASLFITGSTTLSTSTWYHFAICRSGTTTKIFVNGTQDATATDTKSYQASTTVYIGYENAGPSSLNGYIDDFRITKGYARYTTNFTPPTSAFYTY